VRSLEMKESLNQIPEKSNFTIRRPQPSDLDKIAELAAQLGYPCTAEEVSKRLDQMQDSRQYAVYVAEVSGGIAGWIGLHVFRAIELGECVEISGLIVDEDIRSRGVGKLLLDAAEEWARSLACPAIWVHSNVKRKRAHGFYMRNGYERIKAQQLLYKNL
jgi:GNAT superfamily N-acetyltransferase